MDIPTLMSSYVAILLSASSDPQAVQKEIDSFNEKIEQINKGTFKPEPITLAEYIAIAANGNGYTNFGSTVDNCDLITRCSNKNSVEFLSFSELHRFSKRIRAYV